MKKEAHIPVLVPEIMTFFENVHIRYFFDGTLGAGGHAQKILEAHPEIELYMGCDKDLTAIEIAREKLTPWKDKVCIKQGDFAELQRYMQEENLECLDGVLLDLGLSSIQLESKSRGFSFMYDAPLDMRMDSASSLTAKEIVNKYSEKLLAEIIFEYGQEFQSKKIAKAIVLARKKKPIKTTFDLLQVIRPALRATKKKIHPATLVFQALRIYVNKELNSVLKGVLEGIKGLCPYGKIGVISFHSLEDRIVKQTFRDAKDALTILTKKPLVPSKEQKQENPKCRSAKLRFGEKKGLEVV